MNHTLVTEETDSRQGFEVVTRRPRIYDGTYWQEVNYVKKRLLSLLTEASNC